MDTSGDEPLRGKRVVITRPGEQSESFARALRACGAQPILAPTIAIRPLGDMAPLDREIDRLASYSWIVFTSQNGVDAFFARLQYRHAEAAIQAAKLAAIGERTAARLQGHGARVEVVAETFVNEELGRAILSRAFAGERLLLVRGLRGRDVLPKMLEPKGIEVTVLPVYETVTAFDPRFAQKVRGANALTFTSASTVHGFVTLLGSAEAVAAARDACVACIGPITADAARNAGLRVDVTSEHHTAGGLLHALRAYYGAPA